MYFLSGIVGFLFFFCGDINDLRFKKRVGALCFPCGVCFLLAATVLEILDNFQTGRPLLKAVFGALAVLFFALEVYSLFFAIPAGKSYSGPGKKRPCATAGVYALCRHPGVLFFIPLYLCLTAFGLSAASALIYIFLNILLILFEDTRVFPVLLDGWADYARSTPFLIPTPASFQKCYKTNRKLKDEVH